jgi:hypothetical protein
MGIKEVEEVQAKVISKIVNKIIMENFPNQIQEASRTPNILDQNRTSPQHIIIKTTGTKNRERLLKPVREKKHITYKGKLIKITANFSTETLQERKAWRQVFWALNENKRKPRILYPAKLSLKIDGGIKTFQDTQKLKQYMTTKPTLQNTLQGILHTKDETKQTHEKAGSIKPQEKKRQGIRE